MSLITIRSTHPSTFSRAGQGLAGAPGQVSFGWGAESALIVT